MLSCSLLVSTYGPNGPMTPLRLRRSAKLSGRLGPMSTRHTLTVLAYGGSESIFIQPAVARHSTPRYFKARTVIAVRRLLRWSPLPAVYENDGRCSPHVGTNQLCVKYIMICDLFRSANTMSFSGPCQPPSIAAMTLNGHNRIATELACAGRLAAWVRRDCC